MHGRSTGPVTRGVLGTLVLVVLFAVPLAATSGPREGARDALDKETPVRTLTVQSLGAEWNVRHELAMLIAGTTLLVVAAVVRRAS